MIISNEMKLDMLRTVMLKNTSDDTYGSRASERHSLVRYVWEVSDSNPIQQNNLISVLVCFT
jgi:hypothetical protein